MTPSGDEPVALEPDTTPAATAEGNLASVTDDEYFAALDRVPGATAGGQPVDVREGVKDLRHLPVADRNAARYRMERGL